ncbi:hypothetical protein B0J11DRAFT_161929 [Dendryphion nanum]|uniref:Uncharacterized protein n=1 Tax=Dendryphion nanum TaxID=256645 RepID=A0A9P9IVW9_9PLEO|nr:hypothetical protein B0J11DRAFT_161929 [Dendryphion nanum]
MLEPHNIKNVVNFFLFEGDKNVIQSQVCLRILKHACRFKSLSAPTVKIPSLVQADGDDIDLFVAAVIMNDTAALSLFRHSGSFMAVPGRNLGYVLTAAVMHYQDTEFIQSLLYELPLWTREGDEDFLNTIAMFHDAVTTAFRSGKLNVAQCLVDWFIEHIDISPTVRRIFSEWLTDAVLIIDEHAVYLVRHLLRHGADPNGSLGYNEQPLLVAIRNHSGTHRLALVRLLLGYGASLRGYTATSVMDVATQTWGQKLIPYNIYNSLRELQEWELDTAHKRKRLVQESPTASAKTVKRPTFNHCGKPPFWRR